MSTVSTRSRYRWNPSGIGILATGIVLLSVGVLRTEPVSLLLGGGISALGVYVALAGFLATALLGRRARRNVVVPGVIISPGEVFAGSSVEVSAAEAPRPTVLAPPGFVAELTGSLRGPAERELRFSIPLSGRRAERRLHIPDLGRGSYHAWTVSVELRDLLGLSRGRVTVPTELHVRVLPVVEKPSFSFQAGANVGGERSRSPIRRRTDELLETRRYVPGDDIRRVNWKMYARWGELLVRIGEEVPPPRATQRCLLFPGAPEESPSGELCDRLVALFGGYCLALHETGVSVTVDLPESDAPLVVDASEEHRFLRELAAVDWKEHVTAPREVVDRHLTVFAAAGAVGLFGYLAALRRQGTTIRVVMVTPPEESGNNREPSRLHRLLFQFDRDRVEARRVAGQLHERAEQDRHAMRGSGLGVRHVEVV